MFVVHEKIYNEMTMLNSKQQINICKREKESAAVVGLASANLSCFSSFWHFCVLLSLSKLAIANIISSYFTSSQAQQRKTQNE